MSTIANIQADLVEEFAMFDDWMSRYEYVIDLGRQLAEFPEEWKTEANKIQGCQSQVWLNMQLQDGKLHIDGSSDAAIVSGLVAIVLRVYSDQTPADILAAKPDFIKDIGFTDHLSPTRSNGLHSMLRAIYQRAGAYL
ncbi:SufE family protein [Arenicella xantha]|uniref:Cysteine desulfuration protein SufE n=1 Tax=Arenicella xantha TaxID=644221 RepID=A0A395JP29_9GAMM|nr:SufE family protein [Arenicella xantha]RBP53257.1 cysteine desulfuration protein SufE [Arenicella xantha]